MPRVCDHLVKSAIRLERQSTTVPNTSNTSALTAEISDMSCSLFLILSARSKHLAVLNEAEIAGDLVGEKASRGIIGLGKPVDAARARRSRPFIDRLDQRPAEPP